MDYLKNLTGPEQKAPETKQESSGGIMDSVNTALGGGKKSEQKEDYLDKSLPPSYTHTAGADGKQRSILRKKSLWARARRIMRVRSSRRRMRRLVTVSGMDWLYFCRRLMGVGSYKGTV
jgi:hypothetical protein